MLVMPIMTVLCTAGIAFNVRFLVALCKEYKPLRISYWVHRRLGSSKETIAQPQEHRRRVA